MSASTQIPAASYSPKPCRKCGAKGLQRKPRRLFHKLFGIYPYVCVVCAKPQRRVRVTLGIILRLMFFIGVIGGAAYFSRNVFSFNRYDTSQNTAESLARARTSAGGLSPFEQMMIKKPRTTMDNSTILKLWKANVGENVILQLIRTSTPDYDVSAAAVIALKDGGIPQSIILAMIDASYSAR